MCDIEPLNKVPGVEYKKFCGVLFITFVMLYTSTLYFGIHYQHIYEVQEYPMWKYNEDVVRTKNSVVQKILAIGDSRMKAAFKPSLFNENMMNLSLGGGTPIEGYYTLQNYLLTNPKPENIIISYSPFHLVMQDTFWHRSVRYKYLKKSEYSEIIGYARVLNDDTLGELHRWKYYLTPNPYLRSISKGLRKKRWKNYEPVYNSLIIEKGHSYFGKNAGSSALNTETQFDEFRHSKLIDFYLKKLIKLAAENNITIFWYTVPFNNSSCEAINDKFRQEYDKYVYSLEKTGVNVIRGISCVSDSSFGDSSHLYSGVEMETRKIVRAVNEETGFLINTPHYFNGGGQVHF